MGRDNPPDPETDQNRSFDDAQQIHSQIEANPDEYPEGWIEQVRFRDRYNLPPFRPPRFLDGIRVRNIVTMLEDELAISIDFVSAGERQAWDVRIDDTIGFYVKQSRNDAANTIVETTSDEFAQRIYEECE